MSQKKTGRLLFMIGIGSILLPYIGLQFRILRVFGGNVWMISIPLVLIGSLMMVFGRD